MTVSGKSTSYSVHFLAQGREQQSYEMTAFETTILAAFPDIPQLQGLTEIEEMLISAVMPMMSLDRLPLGQYGYSGHVVNLPQDISTFVTSTTAGSNTGRGNVEVTATVAPKVVKKILDLEFVEMAEISVDEDSPAAPGRPTRLPITDISQWAKRYPIMAAILCTRFPDKAPEFWAYLVTIVRAERNHEGQRWVMYDRQFRREALARNDLNWSVTDLII